MSTIEAVPRSVPERVDSRSNNVRSICSVEEVDWRVPEDHYERIDLAFHEFPFRLGELSSWSPERRRREYGERGLRTVTEKYQADAAFLIHPRGVWLSSDARGHPIVVGDIDRHFPMWSPENFGITPENFYSEQGRRRRFEMYALFQSNTPPGFVVGRYENVGARVLIIASNMVPELMFDPPSGVLGKFGRMRALQDGQTRLLDTAIFAHEVCGAQVLGLGAMNALATHFGRDIRACYGDVREECMPQIVTGHRTTTATMVDIAMGSIEHIGLAKNNVSVAIIGAGSIGRAAAIEMVRREFRGKLVIYDTRLEKAQSLASELHEAGVKAEIIDTHITASDWKSRYVSADTDRLSPLRTVDIVLAAPSTTAPYIEGQFFRPGVVLINDSQPPVTTVEMMETPVNGHPGGVLLEVFADRNGVRSTFNTGTPPTTDFTCAIETIAAALEYLQTGISQNHPFPVRHDTIPGIIQANRLHGFGTRVVYGRGSEILSETIWDTVRTKRGAF